jgi:hypothetical protein
MRGPLTVSKLYNLEHFFLVFGDSLFKPRHLDLAFSVFLNNQFFLAIKEVHNFTSVNFEERHIELALLILSELE